MVDFPDCKMWRVNWKELLQWFLQCWSHGDETTVCCWVFCWPSPFSIEHVCNPSPYKWWDRLPILTKVFFLLTNFFPHPPARWTIRLKRTLARVRGESNGFDDAEVSETSPFFWGMELEMAGWKERKKQSKNERKHWMKHRIYRMISKNIPKLHEFCFFKVESLKPMFGVSIKNPSEIHVVFFNSSKGSRCTFVLGAQKEDLHAAFLRFKAMGERMGFDRKGDRNLIHQISK